MSSVDKLTNDATGNPLSTKSQVLETGAAASQVLYPLTSILMDFPH